MLDQGLCSTLPATIRMLDTAVQRGPPQWCALCALKAAILGIAVLRNGLLIV